MARYRLERLSETAQRLQQLPITAAKDGKTACVLVLGRSTDRAVATRKPI
jgi:hypothetical protein